MEELKFKFAGEAKLETDRKYTVEAKNYNLFSSIISAIDDAIVKGEYECQVYDTQAIPEEVKKYMENLGYKVELPEEDENGNKYDGKLIKLSWK